MSDLTLGFWNNGVFDIFAKVRNPQMRRSAIALFTCATVEDMQKLINTSVEAGLLEYQDGYYVPTEQALRYKRALEQDIEAHNHESL